MIQRRTYSQRKTNIRLLFEKDERPRTAASKAARPVIYVTSGRPCQSCRKGNRCQNRSKNNVRPTCAIANTLGEETKACDATAGYSEETQATATRQETEHSETMTTKALLRGRRCNNRDE